MNKIIPEIRRYDVRMPVDEWHAEKGKWLGTFLITHDGMVAINSDYGTYGYWWSSTGRDDIREFLIQINSGYLLSKIAPEREYYGDETEKSIREYILKRRREQEYTKEQAREEWDRLEDYDLSESFGFQNWTQATEIGDAWEFGHYDSPRQAVAFTERVWPVFCDMMRAEIRAEQEERDKQLAQVGLE